MVLRDAEDEDCETTKKDEESSCAGRADGKPRPHNCKTESVTNWIEIVSCARLHELQEAKVKASR